MNQKYLIKFSLSVLLIEKHDHILLNAFVRQRLFSVTGRYVLLSAALVVKFTQELYIKTLVSQMLFLESFCFSLLVVMLVGWYSLYNNVERYPTTSISGGEGRNENLIFFIGHWTSLDFIGHPTLNIGLGEALLWASTRARSLGQHIYLRRIITI